MRYNSKSLKNLRPWSKGVSGNPNGGSRETLKSARRWFLNASIFDPPWKCSVCRHRGVVWIDEMLAEGVSCSELARIVARQVGRKLSVSALKRHRANHLVAPTLQ